MFHPAWCRLASSVSPSTRRALALALLAASGPAAASPTALVLSETTRPEVPEAATALADVMAGRGVAVELRTPPVGADPGDLDGYDCVFDLRVDFALRPVDDARYRAYLVAGGALYLAGEHAVGFRNDVIGTFLEELGGGAVRPSSVVTGDLDPVDVVEPTNAAHPLARDPNDVAEVDYDGAANGQLVALGTGTWLTGAPDSAGAAIWDVGTLASAPLGRVIVVMDVDWLRPAATLDRRIDDPAVPTRNRAFAENVVVALCGAGETGTCRPRPRAFWHRHCLGADRVSPGRRGRGIGPPPLPRARDLEPTLLDEADARLAPYGVTACQVLVAERPSDPRVAALRELAALRLNLLSGTLSPTCPVELRPILDGTDLTVADALREIEARLADGSDEACRQARWIGEHVNVGEALPGGP
jgi:hypothetical protein